MSSSAYMLSLWSGDTRLVDIDYADMTHIGQSAASTGTTMSVTSTTHFADDLVLGIFAVSGSVASITPSGTFTTSLTELDSMHTTLRVAYYDQVTAGSTGALTASISSAPWGEYVLALNVITPSLQASSGIKVIGAKSPVLHPSFFQ